MDPFDDDDLKSSFGKTDFSDDKLAAQFTAKYSSSARYTAKWGKWNIWNGVYWEQDNTLQIVNWSRDVCRSAALQAKTPREINSISSYRTALSVVNFAKTDRNHAIEFDRWDSNPWIFLCDQRIDLKSGKAEAPRREDYCTKRAAAISPIPNSCPLWHKFLAKITNNDIELQNYLKRVAGYCMTGETIEHALFFFYGTGANGKSVFLNTLTKIWGDYAVPSPMEVFVETRNDRHPTELALLQGKRIVVAIETERDRAWAEKKITQLTGGDKIVARFMHQDFFEYTPQFKLMIAGNHKPSLHSINEAIRRRIHLIPFSVTIPEPERDRQLSEKLEAEWPGILAWAIEGCLEWQKIGLAPPISVRDATNIYLEDEDSFATWIYEKCEIGNAAFFETSDALWNSWKIWAENKRENIGSHKAFSLLLIERGFIRERTAKYRGFRGIKLKSTSTADLLDQV